MAVPDYSWVIWVAICVPILFILVIFIYFVCVKQGDEKRRETKKYHDAAKALKLAADAAEIRLEAINPSSHPPYQYSSPNPPPVFQSQPYVPQQFPDQQIRTGRGDVFGPPYSADPQIPAGIPMVVAAHPYPNTPIGVDPRALQTHYYITG